MSLAPRFILGIDTSCDETSVAIYDALEKRMLVNLVSSQVALHARHGGVVPELASREHSENLTPLFETALLNSGLRLSDLNAVAVTNTPGLIGCLLVGTSFAKALSYRLKIPLYAINHLEAHLFSPFIGGDIEFPFLGLVVSGGHTAFYRVGSFSDIELVGQTVDDAAGEAFDKCAKLMGLGYPGGPMIDKLARQGDPLAYAFTIPKVKMGPQYLSFSGIKTALHHHLQAALPLDETKRKNLSASLQATVVETLLRKAKHFLDEHKYAGFALSGGVAMNSLLRERVALLGAQRGISCVIAKPEFCTDNGGMIAFLAAHREAEGGPFTLSTTPSKKIQARGLKT